MPTTAYILWLNCKMQAKVWSSTAVYSGKRYSLSIIYGPLVWAPSWKMVTALQNTALCIMPLVYLRQLFISDFTGRSKAAPPISTVTECLVSMRSVWVFLLLVAGKLVSVMCPTGWEHKDEGWIMYHIAYIFNYLWSCTFHTYCI